MEQPALFTSPYNFRIPLRDSELLYSSFSGAVISLAGDDATSIAQTLSGDVRPLRLQDFPETLADQLQNGGFVTSDPADQLKTIQARFHAARSDYPVVLTLTTTMDCNLGCYYCYEERSPDRLDKLDLDAILALAEQRLCDRQGTRLHVDWYGGEPLLNCQFLEAASEAIQELCRGLSVPYSASLISNGTCWPEDVGAFVSRHRIGQVQISFDGMRENHNRRRRYRNADDQSRRSSFDEAAGVVSKLLDFAKVDIRFNIDTRNAPDLVPFIRFAQSQDWFDRKYPAIFQPARLASYTEHSSFMRKSELTVAEFDDLRELTRSELNQTQVEESEAPEGFPFPKTSVCCALAADAVVIGADGRKYRCGLQVSEPTSAVGSIRFGPFRILDNAADTRSAENERWWRGFDPTNAQSCSKCSFLPVCWGGCPKKHFDGDTHALREQGTYWRRNLARLVTSNLGIELPSVTHFVEREQFRETIPL
jgi:uncharacterized protein